MNEEEIRAALSPHMSRVAVRDLMVDLVRAPSPQTDLLEAEPQLQVFIGAAQRRIGAKSVAKA